MKELLQQLGFSGKEIDVYLALLEFGMQAASTIARKTGYPKSTVLFLFDGLVKRGYVRKSMKGRVQYFFAEPEDLKKAKLKQLEDEKQALDKTIPLLEEFQTPFSSAPKVTFFEGIEGCRKAYLQILESKTEVLEYGAHKDLEEKLGKEYMKHFIDERVKRSLFLKAYGKDEDVERALKKVDKAQCREIQIFSQEKGTLYSSIAIYENKVLILNLFKDAFGILIQNDEVAETMRTIFRIGWK